MHDKVRQSTTKISARKVRSGWISMGHWLSRCNGQVKIGKPTNPMRTAETPYWSLNNVLPTTRGLGLKIES